MADLYTAEAVMEHWDKNSTKEQKDERYRIEQIIKDRDTARKYIKDALARYRKDKTRSRSKAKAEDPFADLEQYSSREDIRDAYGWELITGRNRRTRPLLRIASPKCLNLLSGHAVPSMTRKSWTMRKSGRINGMRQNGSPGKT